MIFPSPCLSAAKCAVSGGTPLQFAVYIYILATINSDFWVTFDKWYIVQRIVELLLIHLLICGKAELHVYVVNKQISQRVKIKCLSL